MQNHFEVEENVFEVVSKLQSAGFETYIVGGAIRDLLLDRTPKDYDISTAATPEEVREVFGRRRARIIGRRFQLVHVRSGGDIFEVSTFRRTPAEKSHEPQTPGARKIAELEEAENMIFNDNDFGTSEEDAWRRDFTVNALFYDPVSDELIDYTGNGIADIESGLVRAIGDAKLRFEEDPVRMLRALKLVGQYGFNLERKTENALLATLPLLELASVSRLSLELEKILNSNYTGSIMQAFADYGLLKHFLPYIAKDSEKNNLNAALTLLKMRDQRVAAGYYRNSASLAMAALALPFIDMMIDGNYRREYAQQIDSGNPPPNAWDEEMLRHSLLTIYAPLAIIKRLNISACRMLAIQPYIFGKVQPRRLMKLRGFAHAMELFKVQCESGYLQCSSDFIVQWRNNIANVGGVNNKADSAGEPEISGSSKNRKRRRKSYSRNPRNHSKNTAGNQPNIDQLIREQQLAAAEDLKLGF
ncbi:MAG: polynucleotide adenylyltransferase PcnB [Lentisphaerae bacterium]|nr:polynucleotide adenylyltransferase PcnB [Lentisphaerota bacterium]